MRTWSLLVLSSLALCACSKGVPEPGESTFKPAPPAPVDPGPATLQTIDDVVGTGRSPKSGDVVRVHYTGTLMNGKKFDSSRDRGTPFDFTLGQGQVIKGWDQGVVGMRVGGKRRLVIPQALGYGEAGSPPNIPPKAGLKFEIELLDVNPKDAGAGHDKGPASPDPDLDPGMPPDMDSPDMEQP
jgi:hypothetical protein